MVFKQGIFRTPATPDHAAGVRIEVELTAGRKIAVDAYGPAQFGEAAVVAPLALPTEPLTPVEAIAVASALTAAALTATDLSGPLSAAERDGDLADRLGDFA